MPSALPVFLLLLAAPLLTHAITCQNGLVRFPRPHPPSPVTPPSLAVACVCMHSPRPPHLAFQQPVFQFIDEFPPPIEPVRILLGVTVTLTASFFDCPLPPTLQPCSDGMLGSSPMQCTWIRSTGGGEVRLVGKPLEPTLANPSTDFRYRLSVTMHRSSCPPLQRHF